MAAYHRAAEPLELDGKREQSEPPAACAAPLAQARGDHRPFGIVVRDARGVTLVVQVGVDLVGHHQHLVAAGDVGERGQLGLAAVDARGIVRVIEDQQPRQSRVGGAVRFERAGLQLPVVGQVRLQPRHAAPDDARLGRIGDPRGARHQELAGVGELGDEDEILRARTDQHLSAGALDAVAPLQEIRHRLAQGSKSPDGQVVLLRGSGAQRRDHRVRHRERRLPEAELEDLAARGDQLVAALVDRKRRRRRQAQHVWVEVRRGQGRGTHRQIPLVAHPPRISSEGLKATSSGRDRCRVARSALG